MSFNRVGNTIQCFGLLLLALPIGCGPSPAERDFQERVKATEREQSASEIREIALGYARATATNTDKAPLNVPSKISSLNFFKDSTGGILFQFLTTNSPGSNAFMFSDGSGFGHWGIIVCPASQNTFVLSSLTGKVVPWDAGVYFWWSSE